ncbi:hypothetical protein Krad_2646 [Kineococcus radiotolerans SRS30216 = ATCC BAA-149]|uniref:Uncharacterized protein n=1 Tax=Kineococcus radiotolerans (strain ATCC BAA-149 / DSM 14245 / SRS30216) TaxID=266940 RepID=A6WBC9_KINRD|nr:hypothetical protein Krad_2646 [Kineococcus radiotolerans SRS30216 = ATCC BAA-149]
MTTSAPGTAKQPLRREFQALDSTAGTIQLVGPADITDGRRTVHHHRLLTTVPARAGEQNRHPASAATRQDPVIPRCATSRSSRDPGGRRRLATSRSCRRASAIHA